MASYNPGDSLSGRPASQQTSRQVVSQSDSSPKPASAHLGSARTEVPREPEQIYHAFERPVPDAIAIGNPSFELALKLGGQLGYFIDRDRAADQLTYVTLIPLAYRNGVLVTLFQVMVRLLRSKGFIEAADINTRAQEVANVLANGVCVLTYMKLRAVNSLDPTEMAKFFKRPKAPEPLEVPAPYALAISQLGIVKVSSMESEMNICPTLSKDDAAAFCLPPSQVWSATQYIQTVEYAKTVGMQFSTVDLKVKLGSSWFLYSQNYEDDHFSLKCPLPEDNYTEATAALHTLFCVNELGNLANVFFDLSTIGNHDYGSMLRNPHRDINVSSYLAVEDAAETIWKAV